MVFAFISTVSHGRSRVNIEQAMPQTSTVMQGD